MSTPTIEEFAKTFRKETERPIVAALYPDIVKWQGNGYSLKLIHAYLHETGRVKCSYASFCRYMQSFKRNQPEETTN